MPACRATIEGVSESPRSSRASANGKAPGPRERAALLLGRAAASASRRLGRGGGTALPGLVAGAVAPELLGTLSAGLGRGVVTVTGTNGKTTTAHLLAAIARTAGLEPLTNSAGSNLERGLLSAFVEATGTDGSLSNAADRLGILEVDEAAIVPLYPQLRPSVSVFTNLFRDQLDRYGEVDSIAEGWRAALAEAAARGESPTLVLNADDPSVAQIAEAGRERVVTFGVDDPAAALPGVEHASDARFCGRCGGPFEYSAVYIGHVGVWRCPACSEARTSPDVAACEVRLGAEDASFTLRLGGEELRVDLPQTGLYSVYNALAAAASAHALGLTVDAIERAIEASGPAFGRQERFDVGGRRARVLLAKNPAGLNEVIRALTASEQPVRLLMLLNDGIQDGRDVSWIYDADLERLAGRVEDVVVSGGRADDLALRLHLAGIEPRVVQPHIASALDQALSATPTGRRLDVVATYTAMIEVREALASRAGVAHYWEQSS